MNRILGALLASAAVVGLLMVAFAAPPEQPGEGGSQKTRKERESFITVLDYGAKGDGATDDAAAIQQLIDAQTGRSAFRPAYRIPKPSWWTRQGHYLARADSTARLVMAGPGPAIHFVVARRHRAPDWSAK
jgi:hypothetical protein